LPDAVGVGPLLVGFVQDARQHATPRTNSYREDQDTFGTFLRDCTIVGAGCSVLSSVLYEAYQQWADTNGIRQPMSSNGFGRRISAIQGVTSVARNSKRYWSGLGLLSTSSEHQPS
jgi:phage/plasmid-associated DNA primase